MVNFAVSLNQRGKIKDGENRDKYIELARELRKSMNMGLTKINEVFCALVTICMDSEELLGNQSKRFEAIVEIQQNTEKSPSDIRRTPNLQN